MPAHKLNKVKIGWSSEFSYAIGLITTDGNLSPDGRHLELTSNDLDQLIAFKECLNIKNKIGYKFSGYAGTKTARIQFGDVSFYKFLLDIGLTPNKSKTLKELNIPDYFFFDFLRGCIDGDGSIDVHKHKESRHLQLKIRLFSASLPFLDWVQNKVQALTSVEGGWIRKNGGIYALEYGKADSIKVMKLMYYPGFGFCLKRKYRIAKEFLD